MRTAFRERAREFHPDRNSSPDAVERMQEVNEAYEVLRDEGQRAAYDRMHRTLGVSAEELARAKAIAAMVLGHMAFGLGFAVGARISNHWTERIHRLEDIPTGVWHAGYEVALESALTGRSESEIRQAALDAAWHAVQFESARLMYRHALAERSPTFTESFAVDIEVNILGSTAAVIGFALGRQNIQESLPASVWSQADEAIRRSVTRSIQLRGGVVTPQMLRDNTFISSVFDGAAQEANRVLRPHAEAIGRRIGRSPNRGGAGGVREQNGASGCLGSLIVIAILIGVLFLVGTICDFLGSSGPTPTPTAQPTVAATSTPFATRVPTPIPGVGECLDPILLNRTPCSTQGSLLIVGEYYFPTEASYPSEIRFASVARSQCPTRATTYVYPNRRSWGSGDRTMWCVR
ncbi:MAG: DnaJ domain-containing protein [Chloroflexi bacterium]|nr:DnaJ domain-containing protein [Chloroflexota bacterium]